MTSHAVSASPLQATLPFVRGMSPAMQTLESVIAEIAATKIPVMLVGESGSGKAMMAQHIHEVSRRDAGGLLKISCASMDATTLASDLGLSGGAAAAGTQKDFDSVFFDEVGELDPACQRSLLYALPDGDATPRRGILTARVISGTSRNLDEDMRAGRFRSELYYRINGVCLRLPALRERKEDIPLLVEFFLTKHAALLGRPRPTLSARTLRMFLEHGWPGNIRELENSVMKIVALGGEEHAIGELAPASKEPLTIRSGEPRGHSLKAAARAASREAERQMILEALARTRWNRKRAAQDLQISYKSLLYKLKQIGLLDSEAN